MEILKLEYDAGSQLFKFQLPKMQDAVDPQGNPIKVRVLGAVEPVIAKHIDELSEKVGTDLKQLLADLYDYAVSANAAAVADPDALQKQANENARALKQIADDRAAAEAAAQAAAQTKAEAEAAAQKAQADQAAAEAKHAELLAQIEAMQAVVEKAQQP